MRRFSIVPLFIALILNDESVARFALGAEIPLGLWSDHENAMLRPGGIV